MFIWVLVIVVAIWLIVKYYQNNNTSNPGSSLATKQIITEDEVFKYQTRFEKNLENTFLPDAIVGRELYIYRNLMRPWYNKLSSKDRYNDNMIQKLREDWLVYMEGLERRETTNFLACETEDETSDSYRDEHIEISRKVFAIEDAFASAMGEQEVKQLEEAREFHIFKDVNREGYRAPEGYEYHIGDDKLHKIKSSKSK